MEKITLGGDRLGSGNKNQIALRNFERSTHNLSSIWRSTAAAGTLIPFMKLLALPGDTFDIDLDIDVKTHPTLNPMFGSYKIQLDVFNVPIRLYQAMLHNNALGIGMDMKSVKLPQLLIEPNTVDPNIDKLDLDNAQINASSLLNYLGIKGTGSIEKDEGWPANREFNAVPLLAYWDIYKNYYANKQEEIGYVIDYDDTGIVIRQEWETANGDISSTGKGHAIGTFVSLELLTTETITINDVGIKLEGKELLIGNQIFSDITMVAPKLYFLNIKPEFRNTDIKYSLIEYLSVKEKEFKEELKITKFDLENIDRMNEKLLSAGRNKVTISRTELPPYRTPLEKANKAAGIHPNKDYIKSKYEMVGLGLKTYLSDLHNNWLSTEWVDGVGGINEITAIDVSSGSFSIDTLNLSNKVYNMLNRIAVSGGSYRDWIGAVYSHDAKGGIESPVYMGGLSQELVFGEVTSTASTEGEDLGGLAGKGMLGGSKKGGKITIRTDEPSYILGIVSLTPRVDYSQGNDWDNNLKTFDDLHKPSLDGIGFQELITDQMAWWDTVIMDDGSIEFKSAGKVPAWVNYMTAINQTYGNFADKKKEIHMTLNRNYEPDVSGSNIKIKDLTTYIDPSKYNEMFAKTDLSSQNFWIQIRKDVIARRKMSAKIMPNL